MQPIVPVGDHNPNAHTETEIVDALHGMSGSRLWSFRYELLDVDNSKIDDLGDVEDCHIDQNWLGEIKRTATFHLQEVDYIDYLTDRIKPWMRLHLAPFGDADWVEWPQGVFILSTPTRNITRVDHVHRQVDGYDLMQILADDKVEDRYTVTAGTAYTAAVDTLLPSTANIAVSARALPTDLDWDPGTSKLTIVNDLLSAINYESVSVDEDGVYQVRPYQSPSDRAAEWTYADNDESLIVPELDQTLDLFSIPNKWVRVVSQPDRSSLVSRYTNSDPASLTSTVRRGRTITDFATVQDAADQATLDEIVARVAFEGSQVYESIEFDTALMPIHSGNDILRLTYSNLAIDANYSERKWSVDLAAGASMHHTVRRVVTVG